MFGLSLLSITTNAQKTCGFDAFHEEQLRANPEFKTRLATFEKFWQQKQQLMNSTAARVVINGTDTTYEIPVVFHIIHTGSAPGTQFNPSDAHVDSVVDYLNKAYAATWPGYAAPGAGGTNIPLRFVLAKRDSACNATTGINRINGVTALGGATGTTYDNFGVRRTTTNGITDDQLKSIIQWNPKDYYNIWVVNKIDGWSGYVAGGGVVGYAQFPGGTPAWDGTVIMEAFNAAGETTLPHELGHAFSLYHTFQGGCQPASNCTTTGDFVCDTDPHDQVSGCPAGSNPCTGTSWTPVVNNIMNYTDCTDRFSAGQNERVKSTIFFGRGSLVQSLGGTAPGAQATYPLPAALSGCATPGIANSGNSFDVGPTYIKISGSQSFTGGYTSDDYQVYVDHTAPTCTQAAVAPAYMMPGQTYPVEIGTGLNPENVRVYIDFDNNGSFNTATETVFSSNGTAADEYRVHTGNTIAIPSSGVTLDTPLRMRVLSDFYGNSSPVPCGGNLQYGQIEDFTVIISNTPLPITISNIAAAPSRDHKSIEVTWRSENEDDAVQYEIQRAADGKSFAAIGNLPAKGDHTQYHFNDAAPLTDQLNFYRLKMIGKDQTIAYSKVVSASIATHQSADMQIYPNPADHAIKIIAPVAGSFSLSIRNAVGQVVLMQQGLQVKQGEPFELQLKNAGMAAGIYYLQLTEASGLSYSSKFVKQ